jgi:riboflavin kinase/FMN adenylyltransferase
MQIYDDIPSSPLPGGGRSVGIGVFDGVHVGHRELIRRVVDAAQQRELTPLLFTFDRHPAELLEPDSVPPYLTTLEEKLALLEEAGAQEVVVAKVTPALLATPAAEFVRNVLIAKLHAAFVSAGWSFRFGHARRGTPQLLRQMGAQMGFDVAVVQPVAVGREVASSTRIRELIAEGDVALAARLLGRPYGISGPVVKGRGVGRQLGVPTANVQYPPKRVLPARGVYLTTVTTDGAVYRAVTNVGVRPTFGSTHAVTVEAHLLGFEGDLYDRTVRVEFLDRIREERRFGSVEELKHQLTLDIARARG